MENAFPLAACAWLLLLSGCKGEPNPAAAGSATPAASATTGAATATPVPALTGKLVEVDLSSAGEDFQGLSLRGPGAPRLLNKPGDPVVQFERSESDPQAPQLMVTISHDKLDVAGMKAWVTDWAKGFSTPGKVVFVTDEPAELEYSVELTVDGAPSMAHGYGVEVKVAGETYACSAPNMSTKDLPTLKGICGTLARK